MIKHLFLLITGMAFAIALTALLPVTAFADTPGVSSTFKDADQHLTTDTATLK